MNDIARNPSEVAGALDPASIDTAIVPPERVECLKSILSDHSCQTTSDVRRLLRYARGAFSPESEPPTFTTLRSD